MGYTAASMIVISVRNRLLLVVLMSDGHFVAIRLLLHLLLDLKKLNICVIIT